MNFEVVHVSRGAIQLKNEEKRVRVLGEALIASAPTEPSYVIYLSSLNNLEVPPGVALTETERQEVINAIRTHFKDRNSVVEYDAESLVLWGRRFGGGVRFFKDVVHGVTLTLEQSRVAALGYDATENDLLAEKKILTRLLSKNLGCPPSSTSLGADVFEFPWGASFREPI